MGQLDWMNSPFNNYRPVSLLCVLSKVYETVMYNRLVAFLGTFDILFENQSGFRKLHSSYMALMVLTDKLIRSLETGEFVIGVYLDFSKAFYTVDQEILLYKISHYGISGKCLDLIGFKVIYLTANNLWHVMECHLLWIE